MKRILMVLASMLLSTAVHAACNLEDPYRPPEGANVLRPPSGATVDLRGMTLKGQASAKDELSVLSVLSFKDVCIFGGRMLGMQDPQQVPWVVGHSLYGAGIIFKGGSGAIEVESALIENSLQDGITLAGSLPANVRFSLKGSWIKNTSDDGIQNDGGKTIEVIEDSLIEAKMGISLRPGADSAGNILPGTVPIKQTLINVICVADDRPDGSDLRNPIKAKDNFCGPSRSASQVFKWSGGAADVKVEMSDSIVRLEAKSRNGWGSMGWPRGTYKNVTVVWDPVKPGVAYQGPEFPEGVTMTTDPTVWSTAKADWLARHGCPVEAECTEVKPPVGIEPLPPPTDTSLEDAAQLVLDSQEAVTPQTMLGELFEMRLVPAEALDALQAAMPPP